MADKTYPAYMLAADNHNIGNTGSSWFDPYTWEKAIGNSGKYAATAALSGLNGLYNSAITVGNVFGADIQENDTTTWITSMDADLGRYYRDNQESVDLGGFIGTALIPGLAGVKMFNAGQRALQGAVQSGKIGGNLARATGLLVPKTNMYIDDAIKTITSSVTTTKLTNVNTLKAIGAGIQQNALEAVAFEAMVQATMFKSPVLEDQDLKDIAYNVMWGGILGGAIGGAFSTAKTYGTLKKAVKLEDKERLPFVSTPSLAEITSPSDRIIHHTFDNDMAAWPVEVKDINGKVVNNFDVNVKLYDSKVTRNFEATRAATVELSGKDKALGNYIASYMTPVIENGRYANGFSQRYYETFNGVIGITRPGNFLAIEKKVLAQKAAKEVPEVDLAVRYVKLTGDDVGAVMTAPPRVSTIADIVGTKNDILDYARKQGFSNKLNGADTWDILKIKDLKNPVVAAQARYVWADQILKDVKPGSTIHKYDIPVLERAWKDGVYELRVVSGEGPSLETIQIGSRAELLRVIKESKEKAASVLLERLTLKKTGKVAIEESEDIIPLMVNTRQSYLQGNRTANELDDLFAWQSNTKKTQADLEARGISKSTEEYNIESIYQPTYARFVYDIKNARGNVDENVLDGIIHYKQQQKLFEENAKRVVAGNFGKYHESLPDIKDYALLQANRTGSGAGLLSFDNPGYGSIGSSMAWIGSVTRDIKTAFRKSIGDNLEGSLVALKAKPEAAIELSGIDQKITRSGHQWRRYSTEEGEHFMVTDRAWKAAADREKLTTRMDNAPVYGEYKLDFDIVFADFPDDLIQIKNSETVAAIDAHIKLTGERTQKFGNIHAARGKQDTKNSNFYRPIRQDLKRYPHYVLVKDPAVTGSGHTTVITAASEKELGALIDKVPARYKVITKSEGEEYFRARGEYEYNLSMHENYIDSELTNKGIFSPFFLKSDPDKIVDDLLQQHYKESDALVMETVRLRYESQFTFLENLGDQYSKYETSKFASRRDFIEQTSKNPYYNYIKTALDISKLNEYPLIYSANKLLDTAVSKAVGTIRDTLSGLTSTEELVKINKHLDEYGIKPAYYDAALQVFANHSAPQGELTKFVRGANSLLATFTLGLDHLNSLNNAIGSNILRMTETGLLSRAIAEGNEEVAGELAKLTKIRVPGVDATMLAPTKLVANAFAAFWKDSSDLVNISGKYTPGPLMQKYKSMGIVKDRVEQLKMLVDDVTLKGTESVKDLNSRLTGALGKAQGLVEKGEEFTRSKLAEEMNRFISAHVMDQLTAPAVRAGIMDEATAATYINTFVNKVEGNIIASQRPMIFQGPIGQAIGLFQSYQFNLMQQLFRYVSEGTKKDLAMLAGLQSTMYGLQSLPGFQAINVHVVGQLSGNTEHKDTYDAVYGIAGRTAGDFLLYGLPSNILQTNIYSRGDINPRHLTILPTSLQETPIVAGWGKFFGSVYDSLKGMAGGGDVWETFLQGVEHNGISRPLAGLARTLQAFGPEGKAYSTSSKGSIIYENDLLSLATLSRLAGGRPLDEAIVNDAMFRVRVYEAARRESMLGLGERLKTNVIAGNELSDEDVVAFAKRYAELGGKQKNFNKWMMDLYTNANTPQSEQLLTSLSSPFSYKVQLLMGGVNE